jgi:phenylacetate-CoA ligase
MSTLEAVYARSPVVAQHAMATAFGVKERILRHGGRFRDYVDELDRDQWSTEEHLAEIQAARLRELVAFSVEHVPYYRELFADLGLEPAAIRGPADLAQLPVLDKETVRSAPERFRPEGLRERALAQTTGGTTGTPMRYWITPSAHQYNYAAYEVRFRNWAGVELGDRMASINGRKIVPAGQSKPPFWRRNLAFNQVYFSAYHLTDENIPSYIDELERFDPQVIVGYVSTVHLIAEHILRSGGSTRIRPRSVLVSSETLHPWIRADIETAFGCPVFDGYGLGELAALITQCSHGGMHISPEYGVVESVLIDGEQHLVGTGLFNRAMPLLRYDTGDVVELAAPGDRCSCGRQLPLVRTLLGRADDFIRTPDGRAVGPTAVALGFKVVRGIREAQIVQETVDQATIKLVVAPDFTPADQDQLIAELRDRLGSEIRLDVDLVPTIARTAWGKRRLIDSQVGRRTADEDG